MVRWCELKRSFKLRLQYMGDTKRRLKDRFSQRRCIEKFSVYLKKAGLASRNSTASKQLSYVVSVSAFELFKIYCVFMGIRCQTTFPIMPLRT